MRKGISELIAITLGVLVTISIGYVVFQGILSSSKETNDAAKEQSRTVTRCSFASVAIDAVIVNLSMNQVTTTLSNVGNDAITITSGYLYTTDGQSCTVWNATTLGKGDADSKTVACAIFSSCSQVDHIRIDTSCSGVSVTAKDSIFCE